ncbi:MAG: fasciclin domain-containing protein [Acidimicrobiia bacterium]
MAKHSFRRMVAAAAMVAVPMTAIGVGSAGAAPAGSMSGSSSTPKQNIVQTAASNPDFSTLVHLVKKAGLVKALSGKGPYTVFAPTNAAFDALPAGTLDSLLADKAGLTDVLTYHVVKGKIRRRSCSRRRPSRR